MRIARFVALAVALTFAPSLFSLSFSKTTYPTGQAPQSSVSIDIDRDGHPDIISSDSSGNYLTVLLGNSSGTFTQGPNIPTADQPYKLVAGDFNNDGYPDVVVLAGSSIQVFLSAHNGALTPMAPQSIPSYGRDIVAVDLNGDHVPDLALTRCTTHCSLETWLNDHTGHFTEKQGVGLDRAGNNSLVAADFDTDGLDDLAVANDAAVVIYHSNGNGTVTQAHSFTPTGTDVFAMAAGDIDAKNGPDLVFSAAPTCFPDCIQNGVAYVYLNDGSGNLTAHGSYDTAAIALNQLMLVDLTGDNRLDIVALSGAIQMENGYLTWGHYVGNGNYSSFARFQDLGMPMQMIARDLNLDSRHDLVVTDDGFGDYNVPPATDVFLNTGSGAYCTAPGSDVLSASLCFIGHTGDTYTFEALGNSPTGVRRMELWVDGHKLYNSPDDRLHYTTTLSSGSHKTEIVAVDQFGQTVKITNWVTAP